jgi:hypothetical protein
MLQSVISVLYNKNVEMHVSRFRHIYIFVLVID